MGMGRVEDQAANNFNEDIIAPEVLLSCMLKNEIGVDVNPQALRLFMRYHWGKVSRLAHKIHDEDKK